MKNKFKLNIQLFAEEEDTKKEETKQEDTVSVSMLERIKKFLTIEEEQQTNEEDFEKRVQEEANKKLAEMIPKAKKEKERELEEKTKQVEEEKNKLEIDKQLEQVQENYRDFVLYQAKNEGKTVQEYIQDNKQYAVDVKIPQTKYTQNDSNGVQLDSKQDIVYKQFKRAGIF